MYSLHVLFCSIRLKICVLCSERSVWNRWTYDCNWNIIIVCNCHFAWFHICLFIIILHAWLVWTNESRSDFKVLKSICNVFCYVKWRTFPFYAFEIRNTSILCIGLNLRCFIFCKNIKSSIKMTTIFLLLSVKEPFEFWIHIEWRDDRTRIENYVTNLKIQSKNKNNYKS